MATCTRPVAAAELDAAAPALSIDSASEAEPIYGGIPLVLTTLGGSLILLWSGYF